MTSTPNTLEEARDNITYNPVKISANIKEHYFDQMSNILSGKDVMKLMFAREKLTGAYSNNYDTVIERTILLPKTGFVHAAMLMATILRDLHGSGSIRQDDLDVLKNADVFKFLDTPK